MCKSIFLLEIFFTKMYSNFFSPAGVKWKAAVVA